MTRQEEARVDLAGRVCGIAGFIRARKRDPKFDRMAVDHLLEYVKRYEAIRDESLAEIANDLNAICGDLPTLKAQRGSDDHRHQAERGRD